MSSTRFHTTVMQDCLARWRAGDREAGNDLLRPALTRLAKLAKRMLRGFPNVRMMVDSEDVLQNSLVRLLRTLQQLRPGTTREFFCLAAVHIRRELLDLARKEGRRRTVRLDDGSSEHNPNEPESPSTSDVDRWVRFHEAVDQLPIEQREVVGLAFYHGWTQLRIAELFQVDERTIRRRWSEACKRVRALVGPEFGDS